MAIVDKAGSINNLSSIDTPNSKVAQNVTNGGKIRMIRETVEIDATDDDGSKYRLARIPANAVIESIIIGCDAITGGIDFDLGFYDTPEINNGAIISVEALANALNLSSANRNIDGLANVDIADLPQKAWEIAGLTEKPNKLFDIVLTGNTVGTATGTVTITVVYSLD